MFFSSQYNGFHFVADQVTFKSRVRGWRHFHRKLCPGPSPPLGRLRPRWRLGWDCDRGFSGDASPVVATVLWRARMWAATFCNLNFNDYDWIYRHELWRVNLGISARKSWPLNKKKFENCRCVPPYFGSDGSTSLWPGRCCWPQTTVMGEAKQAIDDVYIYMYYIVIILVIIVIITLLL